MLKEIYEQPKTVAETLSAIRSEAMEVVKRLNPDGIRMVYFAGSGTSYHACLAANFALSAITRIFGSSLPASEFPSWVKQSRRKDTVLVAISQSGESSDVIAAANAALASGISVVGITNTPKSSLAKLSDYSLTSRAGEEKAVTATKSFTATLAAAYALVLEMARPALLGDYEKLSADLLGIPDLMDQTIKLCRSPVQALASELQEKEFIFLLGSGSNYPTALEGALKLKESCNLHSEGFATREFLHGPMQLVDERTAVLILQDGAEEPEASRLAESFMRFGAPTIIIKPQDGQSPRAGIHTLEVALGTPQLFLPLVFILPLQLYAYHSSLARNLNPDRPGKLTKVVR
jgi:glucosamine--fructose-6-phosphate aminotransferase (isomerizing)